MNTGRKQAKETSLHSRLGRFSSPQNTRSHAGCQLPPTPATEEAGHLSQAGVEAADVIQRSALTRAWGNRHQVCDPQNMLCCFRWEWARGETGQKHPSNAHFPAPNTWIILPSHGTTAPWSPWHRSALSGQENPEYQLPLLGSHRCPSPQKHSGSQLERASKTIKHNPFISLGTRQAQRGGSVF